MDARRAGKRVAALGAVLLLALVYLAHRSTHDTDAGASKSASADPAAIAARSSNAPRPNAQTPASAFRSQTAENPRPSRCDLERTRQLRDLRASIDPAASPEAAITHAALGLPAQSDPSGVALAQELAAARQRWPDNIDLAWLNLGHCDPLAACDRKAALRRLLVTDPDNAMSWIHAMGQAASDGDQAGYELALDRAAHARLYDSRIGTVFLHLQPVLFHLPVPQSCQAPEPPATLQGTSPSTPGADDWAELQAHALDMALGLPSLAGLSGCSSTQKPLSQSRLDSCRRLLARIAQGDTFLEQSIALAYLIPIATDAQSIALRERYRRLQWLQSVMPGLATPPRFTLRLAAEGEVTAFQALAMAQGKWPPPDDWLPSDERRRALIAPGNESRR